MIWMKRSGYCGSYREHHVGQRVTAAGWVESKRDMGGVIFFDLRDREGVLQVVFDEKTADSATFAMAERARLESVVTVTGEIRMRGMDTVNSRLLTGTVELAAESAELLSTAAALPFELWGSVREDLRMQYRYLDLRRAEMQKSLRFRHRVSKIIRDYLDSDGFLEVETPMLTKSTPEGARDYLVPSRTQPGSFYALPQSPQIFKQLLMVGGLDKYYQVARCFRDEDLRADRQPEFTQVDMELSFVEQEDILEHLERLFTHIFSEVMGIILEKPFPRITWQEAMDRYGSDKPDLRFSLPIVDVTEIAGKSSFSIFRSMVKNGGVVRAITVKGGADFSRGTIEELTEKAVSLGAKGMAWIAVKPDGERYSVLTKYFSESQMMALLEQVGAEPGDIVLFSADKLETVRKVLGGIRLELGDRLGLRSKEGDAILFVTDFPQFGYDEGEKRYVATHHPFTMPYPEDVQFLLSDPGRVRAQAYDVVLNGVELGSGSIRIHDPLVQQKMFEAIGLSEEEITEKFGFLTTAFQFGTPPHGGFAFGLDRLVMLLLGADSLREVIAFPKTGDGSCLLTHAPSTVSKEQLAALLLMEKAAEQTKKAIPEMEISRVAALAKLQFTTEEQFTLSQDFKDILAFAGELSAMDLAEVESAGHLLPLKNVYREDVAEEFSGELFGNAPEMAGRYVRLPQILG